MIFGTDLAAERRESLKNTPLEGIEQEKRGNDISPVTEIRITDERGAEALGKPVGRYITVDVPAFTADFELLDGRLDVLVDEIRSLIPPEGTVLAAGLGNRDMTADAFGPEFADSVFATRHIEGEVARSMGFDNLRSVAVVSPGVLGRTGIEALDIIKGAVRVIEPSCVIVADALAALDISRLGNTVQLCDTGISPGSGVGNKRREISSQTLGVPVIAIGVPTVISALTLAKNIARETGIDADFPEAEKYKNLIMSSREADLLTKRAARLVSLAVNLALQPSLSLNEMAALG